MELIRIHPSDVVAVALEEIKAGTELTVDGITVTANEDIMRGHKIALFDIKAGDPVIKYGNPIAIAQKDIKKGDWVHTHNVKTGLSESAEYVYDHQVYPLPEVAPKTFMGYRRKDGRAAIRNEIWIVPIVGCVNGIAKQIVEENQDVVKGSVDGLYFWGHPFGCSQLGGDLEQTRKLLTALVHHPNAGGVLCLALGCENLTMNLFLEGLGEYDPERVKFLTCQNVEDEVEEGGKIIHELAEYASQFKREPIPASNYGTKMNVLQFLFQLRYDKRRSTITHITTNLTPDRLEPLYGDYVADRCKEMFNFIEFNGESLR
jgi:altronate hydrolase